MIVAATYPLAQRAANAAKAAAIAANSMGFSPSLVSAAADVRKSLRRMLRAQGGAA